MAPNPEVTKQRLVAAAESLFAEHGIEGVSLREINTAAGVGNTSALQYHFRNRAGLVRAVLAKHTPAVDSARHVLLDQYVAADHDDLRALAAALVRPSAAKLRDPDGGRAYLRIHAEVLNRPEADFTDDGAPRDSIHRWRSLVGLGGGAGEEQAHGGDLGHQRVGRAVDAAGAAEGRREGGAKAVVERKQHDVAPRS